MNWQRMKEPSFITGAISCVMLVALLASRNGSSSASINQPTNESAQSQTGEFEKAVLLTESHLKKSEFAPAFDMILVASRLAPSSPRLFDLVMEFIEKAKASDDDEVISLVEDLLDRGDSLVHYQSPQKVESSRKRLTEIRQSFSKTIPNATINSPSDSVRKLLAVAENSSVPMSVRSRAVEQARSTLDDIQLDQALAQSDPASKVQAGDLIELQARIDGAENQCITKLFHQSKLKIERWLTTTSMLTKESDNAPPDMIPDISKQISVLLDQGSEYLQEIMPYSKSSVEGAADFSHTIEKQLKLLQRQKNWLYNQQVLRLVREVESKKDWTLEDKIRHLAEVSEELLSPYVLRRHNELWDKVFESLPNEDKKVWAVRLRILRLND